MKNIKLAFSTLAVVAFLTVPAASQQSAQPEAGERAAVKFERAKLAAARQQAEKDAAQTRASQPAAHTQKGAAPQRTAGGASGNAEAQAIRFERAKLEKSETEQKKVGVSQPGEKAGEHAVTAVNRP